MESAQMDLSDIARAAGLAHGYLQTVPGADLRPSSIHGVGLFTVNALHDGHILARLDGQRVSILEAPGVLFTLEWNAISPTLLLVRGIRTSYGYINHSRRPNLVIDLESMELRAARFIPAGEELLLDYLAQPLPEPYLSHPSAEYLKR